MNFKKCENLRIFMNFARQTYEFSNYENIWVCVCEYKCHIIVRIIQHKLESLMSKEYTNIEQKLKSRAKKLFY